MEEFEYHGCKIKFKVINEQKGYIGKGKVSYKQDGKCEEGRMEGSYETTAEDAHESIMKKFRNFVQVGVGNQLPEQGKKYNTDLLD